MQDRYTGDLGDFSKLGILRVLQMAGLSIGVNWYLTPDENHNNDGCHVKYLEQDNYRACDEELWLELKDIVEKKNRKTCFLEKENILRATFFSEKLDFTDKAKPERTELRKAWHIRALAILRVILMHTTSNYRPFIYNNLKRGIPGILNALGCIGIPNFLCLVVLYC